ncbi:MAG: hypothetical protein GWM87_11645, partial [Xanthomonadales bacterium]|nr:hypothetical protein [Xanthomonadales bacterium]NIX13512.1 hypothetical protein [Xanthomonadales bacterium]
AELFLQCEHEELEDVLRANLELLSEQGLLELSKNGVRVSRAGSGTTLEGQLNLLAHCLLQTLE